MADSDDSMHEPVLSDEGENDPYVIVGDSDSEDQRPKKANGHKRKRDDQATLTQSVEGERDQTFRIIPESIEPYSVALHGATGIFR